MIYRSLVGNNSVEVHPNELKVKTFIPPKIVVKIRPSVSVLTKGIPITVIPDASKLKHVILFLPILSMKITVIMFPGRLLKALIKLDVKTLFSIRHVGMTVELGL